ncbi:MAG: SGNH/GDSL hydrolase family protein [Planctomycetota bacterium]
MRTLSVQALVCLLITSALYVPALGGEQPAEQPNNSADRAIPSITTYLAAIRQKMEVKWPNNQTINIVTHGHSVPAGYFKTPVVDTFNAYPHLLHVVLKRQYPHAVINVINTAIGGENSVKGAKRFEQDVLSHRPDLITIDYALNDRGVGLEKSLEAWEFMIKLAKKEGVPVLLLTPTWDMRSDMQDPNDPLNLHAEQIRQLAKKHSVGLVDSHQAFLHYVSQEDNELTDIMSTVNHPNRRGHSLVASELMLWFPSTD